MGARRIRRDQIRADQKTSRRENGIRKTKERERRDTRMRTIIQNVQPPYTPSVLSWLSQKLGKPSSRITPDDIKSVTQA
jgi:hypothetical protein